VARREASSPALHALAQRRHLEDQRPVDWQLLLDSIKPRLPERAGGGVSHDGGARSYIPEHHRPDADQSAIRDLKPLADHRPGPDVTTAAKMHEPANNRARGDKRTVRNHRIVPNNTSWAERHMIAGDDAATDAGSKGDVHPAPQTRPR